MKSLLLGAVGILVIAMMWPLSLVFILVYLIYLAVKKLDLIIKDSNYESITYKTFVARREKSVALKSKLRTKRSY